MEAGLFTLLSDYDARSGVPESLFCQDNQGLGQRKFRKHRFCAQQVLVLLSQLAHNLIQWLKHWMVEALEAKAQMEKTAEKMTTARFDEPNLSPSALSDIRLTMQSITQRGIKRWVRQIFALGGQVVIKGGQVTCLTFNPAYPLIQRFQLAFEMLLKPYGICVRVGKT